MKNRDGLETNNDWQTPDWLYKELDYEFNFDFDPCPYKADFNGLEVEWGKSNFVNPPYCKSTKNQISRDDFIKKAYEEWKKGKTCVLLIPSATGTEAFHKYIYHNAEIRFLKRRVAFKGYNTKGVWSEKNKGKHDSMIVIFKSTTK
ncbi:MAG: hypothetical protein KDC67_08525 [Ignavibacteriae bacterium]|nr:hypothetical protein [Ignavibacteriota bacterium]